ncbi:unnamed protein product [Brassicogethes aeneus]|uniref:Uncharacterized protein n=1 Tax=Brassicogethes aeneus TaxID=1431903 RepID=A0A9P0BE75_BRAAE|nr:unnamed protein product [Brassicogethes aeneus]
MSESSSDSSIYGEESETVIPAKRIKGIFHTEEYKRNVIRKSKVAGKQHTNWRGNIVESRKTDDPCSCKKKCFSSLTTEYLQYRLSHFNNFKNKNEQDIYLQGLITVANVQRKRSMMM